MPRDSLGHSPAHGMPVPKKGPCSKAKQSPHAGPSAAMVGESLDLSLSVTQVEFICVSCAKLRRGV